MPGIFKSFACRQNGSDIVICNNFLDNLPIGPVIRWLEEFLLTFLYILIYHWQPGRESDSKQSFDFQKMQILNNKWQAAVKVFDASIVFFLICYRFQVLQGTWIAKHNPKLIKRRIINHNRAKTRKNRPRTSSKNVRDSVISQLSLRGQYSERSGCISFFAQGRRSGTLVVVVLLSN